MSQNFQHRVESGLGTTQKNLEQTCAITLLFISDCSSSELPLRGFALQTEKQMYCERAILIRKQNLPRLFVFIFLNYWSCLEKMLCFHLHFFLSQKLLCEQRICSNLSGRAFSEFLGTWSFLHLLWALEPCMETSHKVFPQYNL